MPKANIKPLFPLIGAEREAWDNVLHAIAPTQEARQAKQATLAGWHSALTRTIDEVERLYSILQMLKEKDEATEQASARKRRKSESRVTLRSFLMLPSVADDCSLRTLHLTSRSGAEMKLESLSFEGTDEANIMNVNRARELFQGGSIPNARWGLFYIKDGERSAGYGGGKPFLDEVYVRSKP
jgi:hypothetical protein